MVALERFQIAGPDYSCSNFGKRRSITEPHLRKGTQSGRRRITHYMQTDLLKIIKVFSSSWTSLAGAVLFWLVVPGATAILAGYAIAKSGLIQD